MVVLIQLGAISYCFSHTGTGCPWMRVSGRRIRRDKGFSLRFPGEGVVW
jgi:hypothetical protein